MKIIKSRIRKIFGWMINNINFIFFFRDTPMGTPMSVGGPGAMASLSIDEDQHVQTSTTSTSPAKTSNVDTALPTVILPSSQTDKVRNPINKRKVWEKFDFFSLNCNTKFSLNNFRKQDFSFFSVKSMWSKVPS